MGNPQNDTQDLSKIIPHYAGYECKEKRKKSDCILRDALTEKLQYTQKALKKLNRQFKKQGKKELAEAIERIQKQLQTVTQNLQVPAYSEPEFFDRESIPKIGLNKIRDYDRAMTEQAQILLEEVQALENLEAWDEGLDDYFNHLQDLIDGFNQNLMEREFIIASGGEDL